MKKTDKILVLGLDGMDPRLTKKYIDEGKMPNTKAFLERGAAREDLTFLGGHPTVTPSMWTTLSRGCYANVHGIAGFDRTNKESMDLLDYNFDSRRCNAEPLWDVCVEAGLNTLVFHWPGAAWPPTVESDHLFVVDGSAPGSVGGATMQVDMDVVVGANTKIENVTFIPGAGDNSEAPCLIKPPEVDDAQTDGPNIGAIVTDGKKTYITNGSEGQGMLNSLVIPLDVAQSPIKEATGWAQAPDDAKEFIILLNRGRTRRPALVLATDGVYDHVAIYRSKKDTEPIVTLYPQEMVYAIKDEGFKGDDKVPATRNAKLLEIAADGSQVKIYFSAAMRCDESQVFYPKSLYQEVVDAVGYLPSTCCLYVQDKELLQCQKECWDYVERWQADAMQYIMKAKNIDVVFSHYHAIDQQAHTVIRFMTNKGLNKIEPEFYRQMMEEIYVQADQYIGEFLHYLDEGWTVFILSDHALVCNRFIGPMLGDMMGVNIRLMEELGYTVMKKDEEGNELREIDWEKTRAIAIRGNDIYLNIKGRNQHKLEDGTIIDGIVDPEDKYDLEEQIITDLYGYKSPVTGQRVVAVALHNKDAVLLGYGGSEAGDICFWIAEGYNYDHTDSLATAFGDADTSVSPIFIAAGKGIKPGYTERIIRQIDLVPTMATLLDLRMPQQCEGGAVYQILED